MTVEEQVKEHEKKIEWLAENLKRAITYINTIEKWRHMQFTNPKEEEGNEQAEKTDEQGNDSTDK